MALIYCYRNKINNKYYVGKTINKGYIRKGDHRRAALNYNSPYPFHRAIRKYGWVSFEYTILEECTAEKTSEREIYWIGFLESFGIKGYNLTIGGGGTSGVVRSDEYKDVQRKNKSKPILQFTKDDEFIKEWDSSKQAGQHIGKNKASHINAVCNGKRPSAYGFVWKFKVNKTLLINN